MHSGAPIWTAVVALALSAGPANAQDDKVAPRLIDALASCLSITDDAKRLACTDVAARNLVDATKRREVVVVDKEEMKKTRRSLFGFQLPRIGLFGKGGADDAEEVKEVESVIRTASTIGYGKWSFTMEDGARWATTEAWKGIEPKAGQTLVIRKGSLGGYFIGVKGRGSVRGMRTG